MCVSYGKLTLHNMHIIHSGSDPYTHHTYSLTHSLSLSLTHTHTHTHTHRDKHTYMYYGYLTELEGEVEYATFGTILTKNCLYCEMMTSSDTEVGRRTAGLRLSRISAANSG